jgi:hypothetical protein
MATESTVQEPKKVKVKVQGGGGSDTVYALGVIGACMYYMKGTSTPQEKVKAFFKALIWPVTLVYDLFKFLNPEKPAE